MSGTMKTKVLAFHNRNTENDFPLVPATGKRLHIHAISFSAQDAAPVFCAIVKKLNVAKWKLFRVVTADAPDATDVTSAIQAGSEVVVFESAATNSGFLVQATEQFNYLAMNVSNVSGGAGTAAVTTNYYNGSAITAMSNVAGEITALAASTFGSTGNKHSFFLDPPNWALGTTAALGGDSDKYSVQVIRTGAFTNDVGINSLTVGKIIATSTNNFEGTFMSFPNPLMVDSGESLRLYISPNPGASDFHSATIYYSDEG